MELISNKSVLVTGGAGFIGSHLCDQLVAMGNKVVCLDNFSTGKRENLSQLDSSPNFKLIEGDIRNLSDCELVVKDMDFVLHQAALGSVPRSINDPITTNDVNVSGFLNMLVASKDAGVKRFVYAASSSTYGDSESLPKEEDVIGKPLSPYAITKYVNELYAGIFHNTYQFDTIGLRYFNVFGPRQAPDGAYAAVIPKFIAALTKYESPVINGDGMYSRDFTFIENVVQMNMHALSTSNEKAINMVYNVAYGEGNTLNDLIKNLKEFLLMNDPRIDNVGVIYGPNRAGDIPHSLASIERAKSLLDYDPKYDFKSGLKKTLEWFVSN